MTFFRLTWLQCSFLTFFHHFAALLCSLGLPLFYTTPQNLCLPPVLLWPPFWLRCPVLRPKAWSIAGRLQDSSCAWHMFTKKNSFICFISLLLALNFTPLLPTHPLFFSSGPPHHSVLNRWFPQRTGIKPFTYFLCCSLLQLSQGPLKPRCDWQSETSVPRAGSTNRDGWLKERSKLGGRQWKEATGQLPRKTFQIVSIK